MERFTSVLRSAVPEARFLTHHIRFDEGTPIPRTISSSRSMLNPAGPDRFTFPTQRNSFSQNQVPGPVIYDSAPEIKTKEQPFKCVCSLFWTSHCESNARVDNIVTKDRHRFSISLRRSLAHKQRLWLTNGGFNMHIVHGILKHRPRPRTMFNKALGQRRDLSPGLNPRTLTIGTAWRIRIHQTSTGARIKRSRNSDPWDHRRYRSISVNKRRQEYTSQI